MSGREAGICRENISNKAKPINVKSRKRVSWSGNMDVNNRYQLEESRNGFLENADRNKSRGDNVKNAVIREI